MVGGWPESDNKTISVQPNLTGTGTGTELGNIFVRGCVTMGVSYSPTLIVAV